MPTFVWTLIGKICLGILSFRYRIKVRGLEYLTEERLNKKDGILFLPNHPALMDPLFLFMILWPRFRMRPLAIEYIYRTPLLRPWMKLVKAISLPNFDTSVNELKLKKAEKAFEEIATGLKKGENFIFYPAGKLKSTGKEVLGGASGAYSVLQECPNINLVLVRTTGLWGSRFSRAIEGRSPDLNKTLLHCLKAIFENLFFFMPRRSILIEIEPNPAGLALGSRLEFNRSLENWYNRYPEEHDQKISESEPLKLVSYSRWVKKVPHVNLKKQREREKELPITDETRAKVYREIKKILAREDVEIRDEMQLTTDLGMDSLNVAELIAFVAKTFGSKDLHPEDFDTVKNTLNVAQGAKSGERERSQSAFKFPHEKGRLHPALPLGYTLPEALLNSCERMGPKAIACADDLLGAITYKKLKTAALVLAQAFKKIKEKHVAVLLPASTGAYIVIFALQMAKKVPVMLNWTLGPRYLDEMMKASGAKHVISSWRFLDRLPNVKFGSCIDKFVLLEDVRSQLSLKDKLRGLFLSFRSPSSVVRSLELGQVNPDDPAVILFTSGTEANPKGVPLSHKNLLINQRSAMQCIGFRNTDVMYGILPPFHSFGFSVAGLFPLLAGIKIAFYPDPTDSYALAEGIERWKITMFCSAPSFLRSLLHAAKPDELKSVRFFITGAEKTPEDLYQKVRDLGTHAQVLEGYGITECSPIISLNSPQIPPVGVGRIIPDLEMITIHPETLEPLDPHQEGEICVMGPSVFKGYLGNPRSPFLEIQGKKWYRTGDIGYLDPEGNLILSGRLKRFVKFGGEMISLAAIEQTLLNELQQAPSEKPVLAICISENKGQPQLIVFTTLDLNTETANHLLFDSGFSRLAKIADVRRVEEIPIMGNGKIDYRTLQSSIET